MADLGEMFLLLPNHWEEYPVVRPLVPLAKCPRHRLATAMQQQYGSHRFSIVGFAGVPLGQGGV
jgi:hypothetical protein